jgi:hypothetical protein
MLYSCATALQLCPYKQQLKMPCRPELPSPLLGPQGGQRQWSNVLPTVLLHRTSTPKTLNTSTMVATGAIPLCKCSMLPRLHEPLQLWHKTTQAGCFCGTTSCLAPSNGPGKAIKLPNAGVTKLGTHYTTKPPQHSAGSQKGDNRRQQSPLMDRFQAPLVCCQQCTSYVPHLEHRQL